jgi:succinate dehydrogenase / fumarate reductase cytochrome b subunit
MADSRRPTSPHLTIYKPQITSVLSICHRISGLALYAGTAVLVWWLWVIAYAPDTYSGMQECLNSWVGRIALIGWTFAFYFHLSNGLRHLMWDAGWGFSLPQVTHSGWLSIIFTILLTAATWHLILG